MRRPLIVTFLGPSLSAAAATRAVAGSTVRLRILPPAARGDLWRALSLRPQAIALIDGVFEARPAVWHREILGAIEAGVAVFGGASMGALRAAELWAFGMVGVGQVYRWLREGVIVDDSEVALLHAGPENHYRAFTVPLVNVRWVASQAHRARVLDARQARALLAVAVGLFYQERRWVELIERAARTWPLATREAFRAWLPTAPDLKADDARACLGAAVAFASARVPRGIAPLWRAPSPLVQDRLGVCDDGDGDDALLASVASSLGLQAPAAPAQGAVRQAWPGLNGAESARRASQRALADLLRDRAQLLVPGAPARRRS